MFVSANQLVRNYGLDEKVARFFVDREPPENNLYWYEKLLYLRPAPGYLFIPLIVDLLYKAGLDRHELLSEEFVSTMENVGHISALEETNQISYDEAIKKCAELVKGVSNNQEWLNNVTGYFKGDKENELSASATPFKALHRGDLFLFSLSTLHFADALHVKVVEQWFALISTLLLLDDAEDIESDKATGDENAFIESGLNDDGLKRIATLVEKNVSKIKTVNSTMAGELKRQFRERVEKPEVLSLLKITPYEFR